MSKSYNLTNKSDMQKLGKALQDSFKNSLIDSVESIECEIKCPKCGRIFKAHDGVNICPYCKETVTHHLKLDL